MIILICLLLIIWGGIWLAMQSDGYDGIDDIGLLISFLSAAAFVAAVVSIPVNRMGVMADIEGFQSIQNTALVARESGDNTERFAYLQKIADQNRWLSKTQYWNSTVVDIWIPDEVAGLEPIE